MDHRVKPGDDELVAHIRSPSRALQPRFAFRLREWGKPQARLHRPFPFARLAFRPFAEKKGGGDAGRIPSPTAACAKEKSTRRGSSPRKPEVLPASRTARLAFRPFAPLRTMGYSLVRAAPGGLTELSTAGGPFRLRRTCVGTRSRRSRQEGSL